ncbi:MAG TPA: ERG2 family protein [Ktedonobacteraceae bacterium]
MARFVFDPEVIHAISSQYAGEPRAQMFEHIIVALIERYPGMIDATQPWIFSNAGGAMIQVKFLYASAREYVMIFGTPIGTEGHSGRNPVAYYDTVLDGEAWYYSAGQFERTVYKTGDRILVQRGESAGMHIPDHVWMIEYARGPLPLLFPFGLADSLFSTLDFKTMASTMKVYFALSTRRLSPARKTLLALLPLSALAAFSLLALRGKRL